MGKRDDDLRSIARLRSQSAGQVVVRTPVDDASVTSLSRRPNASAAARRHRGNRGSDRSREGRASDAGLEDGRSVCSAFSLSGDRKGQSTPRAARESAMGADARFAGMRAAPGGPCGKNPAYIKTARSNSRRRSRGLDSTRRTGNDPPTDPTGRNADCEVVANRKQEAADRKSPERGRARVRRLSTDARGEFFTLRDFSEHENRF